MLDSIIREVAELKKKENISTSLEACDAVLKILEKYRCSFSEEEENCKNRILFENGRGYCLHKNSSTGTPLCDLAYSVTSPSFFGESAQE